MTTYNVSLETAGSGFWGQRRERVRDLTRRTRIALRRSPLGVVGMFLVAGLFFIAIFAAQIAPYHPTKFNVPERLQPPSDAHPFGTDTMGRDILSRVIYGSGISLQVAAIVLTITLTIGTTVGATAGFFEGWVDEIIMRVTDVFLAFPGLILAVAVGMALGPGLRSAMLAVAFRWWAGYARLVRGQVLATKNNLYVEAARSIGASDWRIIVRHILPHCISPMVVQLTLDAGFVVLTTASLSFVGLGAQPPTPEWGAMVSEGGKFILTAWWWPAFPGLAICLFVVGFNLLGDFLRDLWDPYLRGL